MPNSTEYEYDVAISFLSQDVDLARELADRLSPELRVFVYVDRQEEIAGTDGLTTFRAIFRSAARLVVVLFRDGWGESNWTRVEQEAITDRFLKEGASFLFFLMVDPKSTPPPWVPDKHIRFNLADFGLEQAIGAIKLRVQDAGGILRRETIADRARRAEELAAFMRETDQLRRSERGVKAVRTSALDLVAEVQRLATEASNAAPRLQLEAASHDVSIGLRTPRASLLLQWVNRYVNVIDDSPLVIRVYRGAIILPGESRIYIWEPQLLEEHRYNPDRSQSLGWCWRDQAGKQTTSSALAEHVVRLLLDQINSGGPG